MTLATAAPVSRLRAVVFGTGRSTTRRTLLAMSGALLLGTVVVFATSVAVFTRTFDAADAVRGRTTPAIQGLLAARAALVHADRAAVASFAAGAELTGAGEDFQVQIQSASQSLTTVAEDNMAGPAGSRDLQLIQGLLVTYTGLMGQADAHFRQTGGELLGVVDLWSASHLLHKKDSGIVTQLDSLLAAQRQALDRQLAGSAMDAGTVLVLLLPIVALAAGLVAAYFFFHVRFRRRLNVALAVSAALLLGLTWVATRPMTAQQHLEDSRGVLYGLVVEEQARLAAHDDEGQLALRNLLQDNGCDGVARCGATVERFFGTVSAPDDETSEDGEESLVRSTRAVAERNDAANADAGLAPLIYVLAILLATAVVLAFFPRLQEYRYRPR